MQSASGKELGMMNGGVISIKGIPRKHVSKVAFIEAR